MDNILAYCIMILSPFFWIICKISIHGVIEYDILRKIHSKSYIKKHSGNLWERYFLSKFKNDINTIIYYYHIFIGFLSLSGVVIFFLYLILFLVKYQLQIVIIPQIVIVIDILLISFRIVRQIYEKIVCNHL